MTAEPAIKLTPQEYLAIERQSEFKSEFVNGEMFAMAGASEAHNLIVTNVVGEFRAQLKGGPCRVYPSDMRVRIPNTTRYIYPDVSVVCSERQFEDNQRDILLNPTLIVEVLSPSTEAYDRGTKFGLYRRISSLQEYVLISQHIPQIECYVRQEASRLWQFSDVVGLETEMELSSIACRLALTEVYENVDFELLGADHQDGAALTDASI